MSGAQAVRVDTHGVVDRERVLQLVETLRRVKQLAENLRVVSITYHAGSALISAPRSLWGQTYDVEEVGEDYVVYRVPGKRKMVSRNRMILPPELWKRRQRKPEKALMLVTRLDGTYQIIVVV